MTPYLNNGSSDSHPFPKFKARHFQMKKKEYLIHLDQTMFKGYRCNTVFRRWYLSTPRDSPKEYF